jgi:Tol biopolymer transport system component
VTTNVPAHSPTNTIPRGRHALAAVLLAAFAIAAGPASAWADYGPGADAASANGAALGDGDSSSPSISDDGRYVVFLTHAGNLLGSPPGPGETYTSGLVRRDMVSGAIQVVAPPRRVAADGTVLDAGPLGTGSISGNGRYVIFDTTDALTAGDKNTASDVYVRDMTRPLTDSSAYELASALDGTDDAPDYVAGDPTQGSRAGRQGFSISDDGRRAVFTTVAQSTLPAAGTLAPPDQVLVRLLDTHKTILVTRTMTDGTPVAPAAAPAPSPAPMISGDGSTVTWVDNNPAVQTPLLPGEPPSPAILWRDIDAPDARTRRVAGTSDPDDPGCPAGSAYPGGNNTATGPCFGPFAASEAIDDNSASSISFGPSGISDDGTRVLFVSNAQRRPFDQLTAGFVVYLADMSAGLTRKQGVTPVVRGLVATEPIGQATLAGDGTRIAFNSMGSVFDGPRTIGAIPTGIIPSTNVYVVDLDADTVQRATVGADGSDLVGQTTDPISKSVVDPNPSGLALSDDAGTIAFGALDANLFLGDANGVSDVEVVHGTPGLTIPDSAFTPSAPPPAAPLTGALTHALDPLKPRHPVFGDLDVDSHGVARLIVRVPTAGTVSATASAPSGKHRLRVSHASRRTHAPATVHLQMKPTAVARKAARHARRLKVRITVTYKPNSGRATTAVRSYTLRGSAPR